MTTATQTREEIVKAIGRDILATILTTTPAEHLQRTYDELTQPLQAQADALRAEAMKYEDHGVSGDHLHNEAYALEQEIAVIDQAFEGLI